MESNNTHKAESPLVQALEKVRARDAAKHPRKKRKLGAAEELNLIRDERIAELNHER